MFTEFDVVVSVIVLGSVVSSMLRGAIKDFLTLFAYIGSAIITLILQPTIASFTEDVFKSSWLVNIGAVICVFLITLIVLTIVNAMLLDYMREKRGGIFDRSLGLLFGLFKGILIVSIIHFGIVKLAGKEPDWLESGETYKITHMGYEIVDSMAGDYFNKKKEEIGEGVENIESETDEFQTPEMEEVEENFEEVIGSE